MPQCTAPCDPPCEREAVAYGLCPGHRQKADRGQPIDVPLRKRGDPLHTLGPIKISTACQEALTAEAAKQGISVYELHRTLVEEWAKTARNSKT